jgi:hypothetical protein
MPSLSHITHPQLPVVIAREVLEKLEEEDVREDLAKLHSLTGLSVGLDMDFQLGTVAPKLQGIRMYSVNVDELIVEAGVAVPSNCDVRADLHLTWRGHTLTVPVRVKDLLATGRIRISFRQLGGAKGFNGLGECIGSKSPRWSSHPIRPHMTPPQASHSLTSPLLYVLLFFLSSSLLQ